MRIWVALRANATPHLQDYVVPPQSLREAGEPLIHATGGTKHAGAARAAARGKVDAVVTAQPPQGKVFLSSQRRQQRTAPNPAVDQPDVAHGRGQAQVLGQNPNQRRDRAPFDIEQGPEQNAGPLPDFSFPMCIEVGSKDVAVALQVLLRAQRCA